MCGRFVQKSDMQIIREKFNISEISANIQPSYNIAPGQDIAIIIDGGKIIKSRWGLIPPWAKEESAGNKMINARAETIAEKAAFRTAFAKTRCLVIADGFYEWRKDGKKRIPFYICLRSLEPFGFAGLYNEWNSPEGRHIYSCTIVTTDANELIASIHNRMPVILPRDKQHLWVDSSVTDRNLLLSFLKAYPSSELDFYEVSANVNSSKYNHADNIERVMSG